MKSDDERYEELLRRKEAEWEAGCGRCGGCCGAFEDPCEHLEQMDDGTFCCSIYDERFGWHKTVGGNDMKCVPVRNVLHNNRSDYRRCSLKKKP